MDNPAASTIPAVSTSPIPSSRNSFLPILIILFVLLAAIGFLVYQNRQLQKQISAITISVPPPLLTATPTPSAMPTPTLDLTANWKTYTDSDLEITFKYPTSLVELKGKNGISIMPPQSDNLVFELKKTADSTIETVYATEKKGAEASSPLVQTTVNSYQGWETQVRSMVFDGKKIFFQRGSDVLVISYNDCSYCATKEISHQILSTFKFTTEKLLNSTFSVTLPDPFRLMHSSINVAAYGFDNFEYLVVTDTPTININSLRSPSECNNLKPGQYCLNRGGGWGQAKDIADITVDKIPAKSFYISGGVDNAYHVVQTTQAPYLEFKMYVAGGGLDQRLADFLSSFRFL